MQRASKRSRLERLLARWFAFRTEVVLSHTA